MSAMRAAVISAVNAQMASGLMFISWSRAKDCDFLSAPARKCTIVDDIFADGGKTPIFRYRAKSADDSPSFLISMRRRANDEY